jgi:hypothetical protein
MAKNRKKSVGAALSVKKNSGKKPDMPVETKKPKQDGGNPPKPKQVTTPGSGGAAPTVVNSGEKKRKTVSGGKKKNDKGGGGGSGNKKLELGPNDKATTVQLTKQQKKVQNWAMDAAKDFAKGKLKPGPKTVTPFNENQKTGQALALNAAKTQNALASSGAKTVQNILSGNIPAGAGGNSVIAPPTTGNPYAGAGNPGGGGIAPQPRPINAAPPAPVSTTRGVPTNVPKPDPNAPAGSGISATGMPPGLESGEVGKSLKLGKEEPAGGGGISATALPGATSGQIMAGAEGGPVGTTGMVTPGVSAFTDPKAATGNFLTSGAALNPETNPFLKSSIKAATRPMVDTLLEDMLPSIRGEAATSGNFGSSRQGIAEGLAIGRTNRNIGDVAASMANENYGRGLDAMSKAYGENLGAATSAYGTKEGAISDRFGTQESNLSNRFATTEGNATQRYGIQQGAVTDQANRNATTFQNALNSIPMMQGAQTTGAITTSGVGDVQQNQLEREKQEDLARFMFKQYAPFDKASNLLSLMPGLPGGTTVTSGPAPQSNPLSGALGGASIGASLGSAIPGIGTGLGAGAGAIVGGLGSIYDRIFGNK